MDYCLGIDTSNYTTSLAAAPVGGGEVVFVRRLLSTPSGQKGLRQSEAHFQHTQNLPALAEELKQQLPQDARIVRVATSSRPRPVEGSYMPCFLAGVSAAHTAALAAGCSVFETSHQEGHIAAALYSCPDFPDAERFFTLQASGGTLELLEVKRKDAGFDLSLRSATLDVTAGQLIDRTGVLLGMDFPCGAELDRLCDGFDSRRKVRISVKKSGINLSGVENQIQKRHTAGESREELAHFLFSAVAEAILTLYRLQEETLPLLLCGGVSASSFLRRVFSDEPFYFASPALSTDNAVGVALLGCAAMEEL